MELKDVVTLLSTEVFSDAFDSLVTFNAKVNPFSEVTNSGDSSRRRILETPVTEAIPESRIIVSSAGDKFIVADPNPDYWNGEEIRYKYPLLPVTEMGSVGDVGSMLNGLVLDNGVYAYPYFVRREIDEQERSDYLSGYEVYFSHIKTFPRGSILVLGSDYYRLKTDTWVGGAGFSIAQAVRIESPMQTFNVYVNSPVYDPVTDTYSPSVVTDVQCFVEPLSQDYEFVTPSFTDVEAGDKAITLLKSAVIVGVGDKIGEYRIQSIRDKGSWVTCQARRSS